MAGLGFAISALLQHHWSIGIEWISDIAQTDILQLCGLRDTFARMIWAMDFDWRHLPQHSDPTYRHRELPPGQQCGEPAPEAPRLAQNPSQEASFAIIESDSSESIPVRTEADRLLEQDQALLEEADHEEMWRIHTEDLD